MAVKTLWPITYSCDHSDERDLSAKPADQRAGYARWLSDKQCTGCWHTKQSDTTDRLTAEQWITQKRTEEATARTEWEQYCLMPALEGSAKAADWGHRSRHSILSGAYEALVMEASMTDEDWATCIEEPARRITRASWWIDNRNASPADTAELIQAATHTAASSTENPYA
jgi:hypothetical protein